MQNLEWVMRWTLPKTASMRQTGYNSHSVKGNVHHEISTLSIDLAKNVFQVAGFSSNHKRECNKRLKRPKLNAFMANTPPCRVVMEACYSSHYWGRIFTSYGHTVDLIPAQHVTPFVRGNKNDSMMRLLSMRPAYALVLNSFP